MSKRTGFTLYVGDSFAVIATMKTSNRKTGNMVQVWIIRTDVNPVEAVAQGLDSLICGTCIHRGDPLTGRKRSCYVNVGQAPLAIYKAYHKGNYPHLAIADYLREFAARKIRLGAYGDPALIPEEIIAELCKVSIRHTGYTHQFDANPWLAPYVMASCDTLADQERASALGFRTFRVTKGNTPNASERLCLAESKHLQCADCGLCDGASGKRWNVFIPAHGSGKKNAFTILN